MRVLISSSYKFKDKWNEIKKEFVNSGFECTTPIDIDMELFGKAEGLSNEQTHKGHIRYFEVLDQSDILYVTNYGGYLGKNMALEIGYAKKAGVKIYILEPSDEPTINLFIEGVGKPNQLIQDLMPIK